MIKLFNKINFIKFSFFSFILYLALILFYSLYRINIPIYDEDAFDPKLKLYYKYAIFITLVLISFLTLIFYFFSNKIKIYLCIILYSVFVSFYLFEIYYEVYINQSEREIRISLAKKNNINFDERSKIEVYFDMINNNKNLYLSPAPYSFAKTNGIISKNKKIFPLGGISNSIDIMSNEQGYRPILMRDKFGFRNPSRIYEKKIDVMLIGDSFVEGVAVNYEDTFQGNLVKNNLNTVSLGSGGNGPLVELATLIEYGKYLKPDNVIWFYFENDIKDLENGFQSDLLKKYLFKENFSQNLVNKQNIIDELLIAKSLDYVNNYKNYLNDNIHNKYQLIKILKLYNIRKLLDINANSKIKKENIIEQKKYRELFFKIINKAYIEVNNWEGNFYFVYLPDFTNYDRNAYPLTHRIEILNFLNNNKKFKFIDIHDELMIKLDNPKKLFPFEIRGHFNSTGYRKITEIIIDKFDLNIKE